MKQRSHELEKLDQEHTRHELEETFRFLTFVNRFGGARAITNELRRLSRSWTGRVRILDVGSGGADIPRAIARWAKRAGHDVSIVGVDQAADAVAYARRESRAFPTIRFVRGDARALPFAPGSFDYVTCNLLLHHLTDEDAAVALRSFAGLASRGLVLCDLIRRRRAWLLAKVITLFGHPIVRFDGPMSVRRAFTLPEIREVARRAGLGSATIRPVFGHHFVLSTELQSPP